MQHCFKRREGLVLCRRGWAGRIASALKRSLRNQRVGGFEAIEVVARVLGAELTGQRRGFRKSFFARVQNNQQRLGFVVHPLAFFGHALQRRQPALLRTMKAGNPRHDFQRQGQRADGIIVQTNRKFGVPIRRIEFKQITMTIDGV